MASKEEEKKMNEELLKMLGGAGTNAPPQPGVLAGSLQKPNMPPPGAPVAPPPSPMPQQDSVSKMMNGMNQNDILANFDIGPNGEYIPKQGAFSGSKTR